MVQEDKERCEMKMMVMPLLFLILMAVPTVDASEGNETVVDIPDDVLVILNITEPDSIQMQLYNIYDWMLIQDELMMNSRSDIRELDTEITDLMSVWNNLFHEAFSIDLELQGEIDFQRTLIDELRHEVWLLNGELEAERAMRNNITIMFGLFSVIVIVITYVMSKK